MAHLPFATVGGIYWGLPLFLKHSRCVAHNELRAAAAFGVVHTSLRVAAFGVVQAAFRTATVGLVGTALMPSAVFVVPTWLSVVIPMNVEHILGSNSIADSRKNWRVNGTPTLCHCLWHLLVPSSVPLKHTVCCSQVEKVVSPFPRESSLCGPQWAQGNSGWVDPHWFLATTAVGLVHLWTS